MKRVYTKIGDVFSVKIDESTKKYFQLIAYDLQMLNSDVIRAFEKKYPMNETPPLSEIINGEVEFYAHCVTKWGVKLGYWEKIGSNPDVGQLDHILFRETSDWGPVPATPETVYISEKWYVWRINDDDFTDVGKLEGENRNAEIGPVMPPKSIVERMQTGKYYGYYPSFE